jgi:hypothetical protein
MEMVSHLHAMAAFRSGRGPEVPTQQKAEWESERAWPLQKGVEAIVRVGDQTLAFQHVVCR